MSTGVLGECFLVEEISKFSASWGGDSPPSSPLVGKTLREMLLSTKTAFVYPPANWDGFCDHVKDIPYYSASAATSEF